MTPAYILPPRTVPLLTKIGPSHFPWPGQKTFHWWSPAHEHQQIAPPWCGGIPWKLACSATILPTPRTSPNANFLKVLYTVLFRHDENCFSSIALIKFPLFPIFHLVHPGKTSSPSSELISCPQADTIKAIYSFSFAHGDTFSNWMEESNHTHSLAIQVVYSS